VTGLVQPLNTVANQAAWIAATDVSPEHTAARAAAEKAAAAATGCKLVIARTGAFLAKPSELVRSSVCATGASCNWPRPRTPAPSPKWSANHRSRGPVSRLCSDSYSFCLQPLAGRKVRPPHLGQ